jgi:hypothetical protein
MTHCKQCNAPMNPAEAMLGPVCGQCCRDNQRAAAYGWPRPRYVPCADCGHSVRVPIAPVRNTGFLRCECGARVPYR